MPKRFRSIGINDISCVWDMIVSFVTNNAKEIISLVHVQKCWSLKRFCHLVHVKVEYKNLKHINYFNFNKVMVTCGRILEFYEPFKFSQLSNVNNVTIDAKYVIKKADLSVLKRCKILKLTNCRKTKLPQNIKELELEYSSYNVCKPDYENLTKIIISDNNYDQAAFEQLRHFPNLKELCLSCDCVYDLGICERLDTLRLGYNGGSENDMGLYTSSKDLFLTRLDVYLAVVDLGLFDHLPILTSLSIYHLTSDQNNLDWIVKLKLLKNLHFYYFSVFPKIPMLPNVEITYVE
jgi:hypothetical protein